MTNSRIKLGPFHDSRIMCASFNELTNRICIEPRGADALYLYPADVEAINAAMFPNVKKLMLPELVKIISERDVELSDPILNDALREILRLLGCIDDVEFAVSYFEGHSDGWKNFLHAERKHLLLVFIHEQLDKQAMALMG